MYDRSEQRRARNSTGRNGKNGSGSNDRPRLEWNQVKTFQRGYAVANVNRAVKENGEQIFSWSLGRESRRPGVATMKFLGTEDFNDSRDVIDDAEDYIAEQLGELIVVEEEA